MAQARHKQGSIRHNAQQTGADSMHYDGEKKSLKKLKKPLAFFIPVCYTILVPRGTGLAVQPYGGPQRKATLYHQGEKKMKEAIKTFLLCEYIRLAATHAYVFGYAVGGIVYAARVMDARALLPLLTYVDKASSKNGGTYSLKYRANMTTWAAVVSQAVEVKMVCTVEYLENLKANSKKNRGQLFEELVAKTFGGELETKSNLKFTEGGDMNLDGVAYQIKYTKATFTDEKTIQNLK